MYKKEILKAKENEFFLKNGKPYNGFYYFKGNLPYVYIPDSNYEEILLSYDQITLAKMKRNIRGGYGTPLPILPSPTYEDYVNRFITRYFVQKRVSPTSTIIEISNDQFSSASPGNSPKVINLKLYNTTSIEWMITGAVDIVTTANLNTLKIAESTFKGLSMYLKDPLQFYKSTIDQ